jgi:hemerythrin superfamily protein
MRSGQFGRAGVGAVAGAAVVGLIAGVAAAAGRKAVIQAAEAMTGDWFDVLKAEHLMIAEVFDRLDDTGGGDAAKRLKLLHRLKALIDKHAFQEENVVYPALKHADPDGAAQRLFSEHAEVKTLLYELEIGSPEDVQWTKTLQRLRAAVEAHVREEEDEVFPALRAKLSEEDEARLTALLIRNGVKLA